MCKPGRFRPRRRRRGPSPDPPKVRGRIGGRRLPASCNSSMPLSYLWHRICFPIRRVRLGEHGPRGRKREEACITGPAAERQASTALSRLSVQEPNSLTEQRRNGKAEQRKRQAERWPEVNSVQQQARGERTHKRVPVSPALFCAYQITPCVLSQYSMGSS